MDWLLIWSALESVLNHFYDPVVFWGLPFALAVLLELYHLLGACRTRN